MNLDHVGLTVPDIDRATEFFARAFGARVATDIVTEPLAGPEVEAGLGLAPGTVVQRVRTLRLGDGAALELFEMAGVEQSAPPSLADLGVHHLAIAVEDMSEALRLVGLAGGRPLADPAPVPGSESSLWVYFSPPWGGLIELVQRAG
ncbi:VOC family protein [Pseudonocardia yuanmonensis]|uniref:VOC family protein n=1 Tax=Pseudonocardia yuanmonensis TaxID=1095914 RepID=A0ABP8WNC4_9PSEU